MMCVSVCAPMHVCVCACVFACVFVYVNVLNIYLWKQKIKLVSYQIRILTSITDHCHTVNKLTNC